jgi:hypothetical protein
MQANPLTSGRFFGKMRLHTWGDENHQKTGFKVIPFLYLS